MHIIYYYDKANTIEIFQSAKLLQSARLFVFRSKWSGYWVCLSEVAMPTVTETKFAESSRRLLRSAGSDSTRPLIYHGVVRRSASATPVHTCI